MGRKLGWLALALVVGLALALIPRIMRKPAVIDTVVEKQTEGPPAPEAPAPEAPVEVVDQRTVMQEEVQTAEIAPPSTDTTVPETTDETGTPVTVRVLSIETKEPLAGARVFFRTVAGRETLFTDANGEARILAPRGKVDVNFSQPPEGMYCLRERNRGPLMPYGSVMADGEPKTVTIGPEGKLGKLVALSGRVQLPDGSPAPNVNLFAQSQLIVAHRTEQEGRLLRTDADGAFEFTKLPAGQPVFFYAEMEGRSLVLAQTVTMPDEAQELAGPLVMQQARTADISLKDEEGAPRAGLELTLVPSWQGRQLDRRIERNVATDDQGMLHVDGILPGMEYFIMDAQGNRRERDWYSKYFNTTVTLVPLEPDQRGPITLTAPREFDRLYVTVVDSRGKVILIKSVQDLYVRRDGRNHVVWGRDTSIKERREDGTIAIPRTNLGGAKPGDTLGIEIITENGEEMTAESTYPSDGALRIRFITESAQPTIEIVEAALSQDETGIKVLDPEGRPVAEANVTIRDMPIPSRFPSPFGLKGVTDKEGVFRLKGNERQRITRHNYLQVELPGYALCWVPTLISGRTRILRLDNSTRLAGTLLQPDGNPAADAEIHIVCAKLIEEDGGEVEFTSFPLYGRSDAQGNYDTPLMPGVYSIEVQSPTGHAGKWPALRVERGKTTPLPDKLGPAARLEIHAVDSLTGAPVSGVRFSIKEVLRHCIFPRQGSERTTNDAGVAMWDTLPPGTVEIDFDRLQYTRGWSDQDMNSTSSIAPPNELDGTHIMRFDVARDMKPVTVRLEQAVTVTGHILDPQGQPLGRMEVSICGSGPNSSYTSMRHRQTSMVADGSFHLTLPAGKGAAYAVIARDPQNRWANVVSEPFQSKPGDALNFDLTVTEGGQVAGRVVDPQGNPVADVEVEASLIGAMDSAYFYPRAQTDADGQFTIKAMRPGEYTIYPDAARSANTRKAGPEQRITVREGATESLGDLTWTEPLPSVNQTVNF